MHTLVLLSILSMVFVSCSKQSPRVETKRVIVQEDQRNISALQASNLVSESVDTSALNEVLSKIGYYHKADFSFEQFWQSLRFPKVDISKLQAQDVISFSKLGNKSCSTADSEAYILFLLYLRSELKKDFNEEYLQMISSHFSSCGSRVSSEFSRLILKEILSLYRAVDNESKFTSTLLILRKMANMKDVAITEELRRFLKAEVIEEISGALKQASDVERAVEFSSLLKDVNPFNKNLYLIPVQNILKTDKDLELVLKNLDYLTAHEYINLVQDNLPLDKESVKSFSNLYLEKLSHYFQNKIIDEHSASTYLDHLESLRSIHNLYNDSLVDNLDFIDRLSKLVVNKSLFSRISLERKSQYSLVAATVLVRLFPVSLNELDSINGTLGKTAKVARMFFQVKGEKDHAEKYKLKANICKEFAQKELSILPVKLGSGCFKLKTKSERIQVNSVLDYSYFSVLDVEVKEFQLLSTGNSLGVIDLSSNHEFSSIKRGESNSEDDAIVVPLLIGVHSQANKGIYLKNSKYYFFYHWVYSSPKKGQDISKESFPLKGFPGGNLILDKKNSDVYSFISLGSNGQNAPAANLGGRGYQFGFDEVEYEIWTSEFIDYNSYVLSRNLRTVKNLKDLLSVVSREGEQKIIAYLDPNYLKLLSESSRAQVTSALSEVNRLEAWNCSTTECSLGRVVEKAISEFSALSILESYDQLLINMNSKFHLKDGELGNSVPNGERGNNGKVIFTTHIN